MLQSQIQIRPGHIRWIKRWRLITQAHNQSTALALHLYFYHPILPGVTMQDDVGNCLINCQDDVINRHLWNIQNACRLLHESANVLQIGQDGRE